ncbi:iron uptake porin [Tolypothrix sp. FACHB-123]|uniref:iron uptake porin n=1 Tax=Tolypothrix sp. FACHB-123 TaxID=2692868 RepID=UPI00280BA7A6|nr:iron uptake porin [Tolypothrix sp. FACHB-123]
MNQHILLHIKIKLFYQQIFGFTKLFRQLIYFSSATISAILSLSHPALANDIINTEPSNISSFNSVSQLSDLKFTDWAFQALQSLEQRYGCQLNYHSIYAGNQTLTRDEFAIHLNSCWRRIQQLITANQITVNQDDLATLQRLQTEFSTELSRLERKIENLELQTTQLQTQQFSTTTKLTGEAIFAITGAFGEKKSDRNQKPIDDHLVLNNRVRLNLDTSFSGKDRFRVRLQAANISNLEKATGTDMARLGFESDNDNELNISRLEYTFPISKQARISLSATGSELSDFADTVNPFFIRSSLGAISRFGRHNPIYRQSAGMGIGIDYQLSKNVNLSIGYIADNARNPRVGISKSPYGAIVQLTLRPSNNYKFGLTYIRSFNNINTATGSELANDPFNDKSNSITANSYGLQTSLRLSRRFTIGGWFGLTQATAEDITGKPSANILNYAITLAFPDLGKKGNLGGIIIGQPPKVMSNDFGSRYQDKATAWHLEMLYRFQINDNIAITPGLLIITNPEHKQNSDTVYVGTIRTTFSF